MNQAEFEKARSRLKRAKRDILWALKALQESETASKTYELEEIQNEQFRLDLRKDLEEIQSTLAQVFSRRETIRVERTVETVIDDTSLSKDTTTQITQDVYAGRYFVDVTPEAVGERITDIVEAPDIPDWPEKQRAQSESIQDADIPTWPNEDGEEQSSDASSQSHNQQT